MSNLRIHLATTLAPHVSNLEAGAALASPMPLLSLDLRPRDYLRHADDAFDRDDTAASLVEGLTNLKRALDSQLLTVLHAFNLDGEKKLRHMPAKLEFLDRCGFCYGNGLKKLNQIRNRIEHEFQVPSVADPDLYRDLITTFIHACEGITIFAQHREIEFWISGETVEERSTTVAEFVQEALSKATSGGLPQGVSIRYEYDQRRIVFWGRLDGEKFDFAATPEDWEDFEYFMRLMYGFYEFSMLGSSLHDDSLRQLLALSARSSAFAVTTVLAVLAGTTGSRPLASRVVSVLLSEGGNGGQNEDGANEGLHGTATISHLSTIGSSTETVGNAARM
ncbi:MAG: hypothetical protein EOP84_06275 [Verrucomicrobiaceae bacterium]|nr:MAG: hypothetical protein EOP84_06275 [Verrucomicrobiaceae bacterium]